MLGFNQSVGEAAGQSSMGGCRLAAYRLNIVGLSRLLLVIDAENKQRYTCCECVCVVLATDRRQKQTKQRDVSAEATPPLLNMQVVMSGADCRRTAFGSPVLQTPPGLRSASGPAASSLPCARRLPLRLSGAQARRSFVSSWCSCAHRPLGAIDCPFPR